MKIDAHQHFWTLARGDYGWLTPDIAPLYRDFIPDDLKPLMQSCDVNGTVLVQAAPTVAETHFMLNLAVQNPFILGVVGWLDFTATNVAKQIATLAQNPKLVGLRPMIQDIADDDWMLRDDLAGAFDAVIAHDLTFDALVMPRHLQNLLTLTARYPDLRVVIDHAAKPDIAAQSFEPWATDMARLASQTECDCKISGLVTEAADHWTANDITPYIEHLLHCFGRERLIWGSDWPVATLASDYKSWHDLVADIIGDDPDVFGRNAQRAYRLT